MPFIVPLFMNISDGGYDVPYITTDSYYQPEVTPRPTKQRYVGRDEVIETHHNIQALQFEMETIVSQFCVGLFSKQKLL